MSVLEYSSCQWKLFIYMLIYLTIIDSASLISQDMCTMLVIRDTVRTRCSVQSLSHVQLFATPWITERQASLSITNSQSLPKFMCIELVMPPSHLILCRPCSSCLPSFPASGSFPVSHLFTSGGQSWSLVATFGDSPLVSELCSFFFILFVSETG